MEEIYRQRTDALISFIWRSPTAFQAVDEICSILNAHSAIRIYESDPAPLKSGATYYITRNGSSVIAFTLPDENPESFMIAASHTDSPCFKIKPSLEKASLGKYILLDTEKYGGMIISSWIDRPLSVAGRIAIKNCDGIEIKNVTVDRDLVVIPNLCIHFNRSINDGYKYDPKKDTLPILALGSGKKGLLDIIAECAGVDSRSILSHDLFLYNRTAPSIWGAEGEFFSAPRIDNLECAYTTLAGFLESKKSRSVKIYAAFDNEEVGSSTKQGAASGFLDEVIDLICRFISPDPSVKRKLLASSLMLSADNAHARHPLFPEYSDAVNAPDMNSGIVIKTNANQKYTTDSVSAALFSEICRNADVPFSFFANRSDIAGGSTLGSISNTKVALNTVDIGLAQLAMHSSYESAGTMDAEYMVRAVKEFYGCSIIASNDRVYRLSKFD